MRAIGVSRVLNERDVIEPFVRHHAALLDHHIVLDNGSTDGTIEILRALHADGLSIELYRTVSPIFQEREYNTALYRLALAAGADWVLFLDADELLQIRGGGRAAEVLGVVPEGVAGLRLGVHRYRRPEAGLNPFASLRWRSAQPEMFKIAVSRLDPARVSIYAGNHFMFLDGREEHGLIQDRLWLAHLPNRSPVQMARKAILGRLKAMAAGRAAADHFSVHRHHAFERLKADPRAWLEEEPSAYEEIEEEAPYLGASLRYTATPDDVAHLLMTFAAQSEVLARAYGDVLERKRLLRQEALRRAAEVERLL